MCVWRVGCWEGGGSASHLLEHVKLGARRRGRADALGVGGGVAEVVGEEPHEQRAWMAKRSDT